MAKTGLGSSAALTTSLVGALLQFDGIVDLNSGSGSNSATTTGIATGTESTSTTSPTKELELIHNLAQVAHSLAQGKVGSGFDVSSAVYGTYMGILSMFVCI